jgi:hypothetical protein
LTARAVLNADAASLGRDVGHAEPAEWLGSERAKSYPLHLVSNQLVSNQPRSRLHSQLDCGEVSRVAKVANREPVWFHPGVDLCPYFKSRDAPGTNTLGYGRFEIQPASPGHGAAGTPFAQGKIWGDGAG